MPHSKLKTTTDFLQWKESHGNHPPVLSAQPCLGDKSVSCLPKVGALGSGCLQGTKALLLTHFLPITITGSIVNFSCVGQFFPLSRKNASNRMLRILRLSCDCSSRRVKRLADGAVPHGGLWGYLEPNQSLRALLGCVRSCHPPAALAS